MRKLIVLTLTLLVLTPTIASARTLSRSETRALVCTYAKQLHVSSKWLAPAAIDIIYTGAHESGGDEKATNGRHRGILQFRPGWHATKRMRRMARAHGHAVGDWRLCGECSLYRFVKSYKDGGRSAIRRHWRSTLGH